MVAKSIHYKSLKRTVFDISWLKKLENSLYLFGPQVLLKIIKTRKISATSSPEVFIINVTMVYQ